MAVLEKKNSPWFYVHGKAKILSFSIMSVISETRDWLTCHDNAIIVTMIETSICYANENILSYSTLNSYFSLEVFEGRE